MLFLKLCSRSFEVQSMFRSMVEFLVEEANVRIWMLSNHVNEVNFTSLDLLLQEVPDYPSLLLYPAGRKSSNPVRIDSFS